MAGFRMVSNLMARRRYVAKSFVSAAFFLGAFANFFQIIGIFGPTWMYTEQSDTDSNLRIPPQWTLNEGIWLSKYCSHYGKRCSTSYRQNVLNDLPQSVLAEATLGSHWLELQILSILSLVCSLITVFAMHFVQRRKDLTYDTQVLCGGTLCSCLSCLCLLVPVIKTWYADRSSVITCWARSSAAVGTLIEFVIIIVLVLAIYRARLMKLERDRRHARRSREMMAGVIVLQGNDNQVVTEEGRKTETHGDEAGRGVQMTSVADKQDSEMTIMPKIIESSLDVDDQENGVDRSSITTCHTTLNTLQDNNGDKSDDKIKQAWDQSFLVDDIADTNTTMDLPIRAEESLPGKSDRTQEGID